MKIINLFALAFVCLIAVFIIKRISTLFASKEKHKYIHDVAEDVALASRVAAAIAAVSAYFLAPAGLLAIIVDPPLIVVIAPAIGVFAVGAYVAHALARLYDKKRKKIKS